MKFFTLDLLRREDGEGAWERAVADYEAHIQIIRTKLPAVLQDFLDHCCLHDARVLAAGINEEAQTFFIAVQFEGSDEGAQLTFRLAEPPKYTGSNVQAMPLRWAYEEMDMATVGDIEVFRMNILFSDDAELQLAFSEFGLLRFRTMAPMVAAPLVAS